MANHVGHLNQAKANRDDEFYTLYSDVSALFKAIRPYIMGYTILLPFDSMHSNFVKFLKQNSKHSKYVWYNTTDYASFEEYYKRPDVVVVSNPPFSIKKDILAMFKKYNTKFVLILPCLIEKTYLNYIHTSIDLKIQKFYRPDRTVQEVKTYVYSNFINFAHKVRYDKNCPHLSHYVNYKRGDVYWDCFLKHGLEFSCATWLAHMIDKPDIVERKGQFRKLKMQTADALRLYHYHRKLKERIQPATAINY